ncbi:CHAD domain-containing protein [Glycomyces salinus]|uniref:CHAD domain-containing protein n=1 Tax=Glycomyces salinus TaxID=980294 RepID=UPI0018EC3F62|nr:CHAD domain-containing protein [Glycomyces salinus]
MIDPVSAGAGVHPYMVRQADALRRYRGPALRAEEDAVHRMRVATRRLRSLLSTFGPLYADTPLSRKRLRWLTAELGEVRDLEVLRMRFAAELGRDRPDWFGALESAERGAYRSLARSFGRPRFARLMAEADAMAAEPRFSLEAVEPAAEVLGPVLASAESDLEASFGAIASARDPDAARHRARKTAKRVRYTAEAAAPALGDRAEALAAEAKRLQTLSGRCQDGVVAVAYLEAHTDPGEEHRERVLVEERRRRQRDLAALEAARAAR